MKLFVLMFILASQLPAVAQQGAPLSSTERAMLINTSSQEEAKVNQQQAQTLPQPPQANPQPMPANPPPMPQAEPQPNPAPVNPAPPPPEQPSPGPQAEPPMNVPPLASSPAELAANGDARVKSPFMIPDELFQKFKSREEVKKAVVTENTIDEKADPKRRWPLREYALVGVIWNVKKPKAFIQDKNGKVHAYLIKDVIGNAQGYVAEINNGEVIVIERGAEVKLKLRSK